MAILIDVRCETARPLPRPLPPSPLIIFDFPIRFLSCPSSNFVSAPSQSLHFPSTLSTSAAASTTQSETKYSARRKIEEGIKT